jgi:hypothetical protein
VLPCTHSRALADPSRLSLYTQMSLWMRRSLGTSLRGIEVPSPGGVPLGVSAQTQDTKNEFEMIFRFFCVVSIEKTLPLFIGIVRVPVKRHPGESVLCRIWAQGARAGDPQIFSLERFSIQKLSPEPGQRKPRTPPTDASHAAGRVGGGRRPAAHAAAAPASVRGSLCGLRTRTRRGGDDGGARRVETRWGAARVEKSKRRSEDEGATTLRL